MEKNEVDELLNYCYKSTKFIMKNMLIYYFLIEFKRWTIEKSYCKITQINKQACYK